PTEIAPESKSSSPAISLSAVDFPHPDGPTMTRSSPFSTSRLTSSSARWACSPRVEGGKVLLTQSRTSSAILLTKHIGRPRHVAELLVRLVEWDVGGVAGSKAAIGRERDARFVDVLHRLLHAAHDRFRRVDDLTTTIDTPKTDVKVER